MYVMKLVYLLWGLLFITSCSAPQSGHQAPSYSSKLNAVDSVAGTVTGKTYLPVYSQIYQRTEKRVYNLTVTISMRNTSENSLLYITHANYFNTDGTLNSNYLEKPIVLQPLETGEFIIAEEDQAGGTGGNFLFEFASKDTVHPIFEAVMISTMGQQGLSFATRGERIE